jgi:hypothetical protein
MAKRNSTRRAARKPKFIEVEGHQLTPAMHADYERCLERRSTPDLASRSDGAARILELGLADFLARYRPSHKAGKQIQEIHQTTSRVSLAVATMGEYPFFADNASIRPAGCELLKKLGLDLYHASAKLTAIATDVETESGSKVQDWVAQSERLEQMGKSHERV